MDYAEVVRRQMFGNELYEQLKASGAFEDGIACPPEEELVRKEFQKESSIEYQLKMFASGGMPTRMGHNGFVDYDMDRLSALELLGRAEQLFEELPASVREKFKTWPEVEAAALNGELAEVLKPKEPVKEEPKS